MNEKPVLLGEAKSLVGILTEPRLPAPRSAPAVLFFNAGLMHRVGPNRLYVKIARGLAAAGFTVLRFDFSGIGDSRPRTGGAPFEANVLKDAREAMDFLAATRCADRFILIGFCSGAHHAIRAACVDERVVGLGLIDPYSVSSPGYFFDRYVGRLLRLESWRRLIMGKSLLWRILKRVARRKLKRQPVLKADARQREAAKNRMVTELRALARRRVEFLFAYSGDGPSYYNYRAQLGPEMDRIDFEGRFRLRVLEESDHTFTLLRSQEWLAAVVHEWVLKARGDAVSSPSEKAPRAGERL
jgi:pimeloyl-ACP methyl ester carboxylesterase